MSRHHHRRRGRVAARLLLGALAGTTAVSGAVLSTATAASAQAGGVSASFTLGILTVTGDGQDNNIAVSRDAAGLVLVNGGAVPVKGVTATVANVVSINLLGRGGNDTLTFDEANGALPRGVLTGGPGNDTITGGSGGDTISGQAGTDTLLGKGGTDRLFGGSSSDVLTGGDADDQVFGEIGDDRMIWNPGDDTDLNEGGVGTDTTEVNGAGGTEVFTTTANGARVRFDRIDPAPFAVDMGTTEKLLLNANGGDDRFSATGNLAALVAITVDGGAGNETLLGSNGIDLLIGGTGNDFVDGQQGNDVAFLGAGDDAFQWDPGDGSDIVEGQDGADDMLFNGSNGAEIFEASAVGSRVRFTRNLANIVMDLDDVEQIDLNALGSADTVVVNDLSGTEVTRIETDLAAAIGGAGGDLQADNVVVAATNGDDVAVTAAQGSSLELQGLPVTIGVTGVEPGADRLTVKALNGADVVDASGIAAASMLLTVEAGDGDDVVIGGDGDDLLKGEDGDDVLIGGPGFDTLDGGAGENVLIDGENLVAGLAAGTEWLAAHTRLDGDKTVMSHGERSFTLPAADLVPSATAAPTS